MLFYKNRHSLKQVLAAEDDEVVNVAPMSHPDWAKFFLPQERKESMQKLSWMESQKESGLVREQDDGQDPELS